MHIHLFSLQRLKRKDSTLPVRKGCRRRTLRLVAARRCSAYLLHFRLRSGVDIMSNVISSAELQKLIDLEHTLIRLIIALLALAYFTVGLRLWVRLVIVKGSGWDDTAIVVALVSIQPDLCTIHAANSVRFGSHVTVGSS